MRKLRVSMVAAGLMLLGAACSSSDAGMGDLTGTAAAGEGTVVTAALTSDESTPADSTLPADTAAPTRPAGDDDECLQGTWLQNSERMQAFLSQLGTPITLTVLPESLMTLTIDGASMTMVSTITLQAVVADSTMQTTGSGNYAGTFSADAGSIDVVLSSQEFSAGDWVITIDGQTAAVPGMTPVDPGPPINGVGSYTCSDTTLEVVASGRTSTFDRG